MNTEQFKGQLKVFFDVQKKRHVQDDEWGGPAHDDTHKTADFLEYIDKQVGKADAAVDPAALRDALISIAGLAFAAVESMDRGLAHDMPETPARYSWEESFTDMYRGELDSISEAIADALQQGEAGNIKIGRIVNPTPASGLGYHVLEQIECQLNDDCGEAADGSLDCSKEQEAELSTLVEAWADVNLHYGCWQVVDVQEYSPDSPEYVAALALIKESGDA
jgi:hypothetical protein